VPQGGQERPGWQVRISPAVTGPDGHLEEDRVPSGGGVFVGGRWVLTCAHVIGPEPRTVMARFSFAAGEPVPATVAPQGWRPGDQGDLALLELDRDPPSAARPASLRPAGAVTGHACAAYGYPVGYDIGVWSNPAVTGQTVDRLQLTAQAAYEHQIKRGFSGTGLFDTEAGFVVGLVVTRDKDEDVRGGFAIPLQAVATAFPQLGPWVGWRLGTDGFLHQHWRPRARGVYKDSTPGWYFTGRTALLRELTGWLEAGVPDRAVRVVTGPAGTGKSAVLAWLCALSDPQLRAEIAAARPGALADAAAVPDVGRVEAAIWARDLDADGAAGALAAALALPVAAGAAVEDVLAAVEHLDPAKRGSLVVVLDALDEARTPREIARRLLLPLARDLGVKVLAGTRPGPDGELLEAFGERAVTYRLDNPAWFDRQDLSDYAAACLRADFDPLLPSGYRSDPGACGQVAKAIADAAGSNFLVAGLAARARADEPVVDVSAPGWRDRQRFPAEVGQAFEDYLSRFGKDETRAWDLLRAIAYAQGTGLPADELWAAMASALAAPRRYGTDDLAWLLGSAASYLVESGGEHGRPAYRIFHQALIDHLRPKDNETRAQRELVEALMRAVPVGAAGPDWACAPSYIRQHLAAHAAAAEGTVLDSLLENAAFLAGAEPAGLLVALPAAATPRGREIARTVARVGQQLLQALPGEQACYLEMAAQMAGDERLARAMAAAVPQRPWSVPWARWQALDDGQLLGQLGDDVLAVSTVDTAAGTVVVAASTSAVRTWRLADGSPAAPGIRELPSPITEMAAYSQAGEVIVLTGHEDGELRRTTVGAAAAPQTRTRYRAASQGPWLISYAGQPAVVTIARDGLVKVTSVTDGHPVGLPSFRIADGEAIVAGNAGQRCLLATVLGGRQSDSEVLVWDLETGTVLGSPLRPAEHLPDQDFLQGPDQPLGFAAAITEVDGQPILLVGIRVAAAAFGGMVVPWDPVRGKPAGKPRSTPGASQCVLRARYCDGQLWCWGDVNGYLYLARDDDAAVEHIAAHDYGISSMTACEQPDGPVIITGGEDGAVRAWRPDTGRPALPASWYYGLVATRSAAGDRTLITWLADDGTCPVLDPADGQIVTRLRPSADARISHITPLSGQPPAVITTDTRDQVTVWRPPDSQPKQSCQLPAGTSATAIAAVDGSQPMLLTAMPDGHLGFFDLTSGQPARAPLNCHTTRFILAADPQPPSGTVRFLTATPRPPSQVKLWTTSGNDITKITQLELQVEPDPYLHRSLCIYGLSFGYLNGRRVAAGAGELGSLHIWYAADGSLLKHTQFTQSHRGSSLNDVDIRQGGGETPILAVGYICSLVLWRPGSREEHYLRVGSPLWSVKSLPRGQVVVAGPRGIMAIEFSTGHPSHQ